MAASIARKHDANYAERYAVARFLSSDADLAERDHEACIRAIRKGRIEVKVER